MPGWLLFLSGVVALAGIYAVLTLALNLHFGYGGLINFGIVAFFAIGGYTYTILTMPPPGLGEAYRFGFGFPWWLAFPAAGMVAAVFALVIGLPTLRVRGEYLLIVTFAFAEVVRSSLTNEAWLTNGARGFYSVVQPFRDLMDGQTYQVFLAVLILAVLAICYLVARFVGTAPFGRTLRAVRENEDVALSVSKDVYSFRLRAFVLGSIIAGLAGAMYVWYMTIAVPAIFAAEVTFAVWIALVIGGTGSNRGAILGAFVLLGAQQAVKFIQAPAEMAAVISSIQLMLEGLLLVVILRFRPMGLLPEQSPPPPRERKQPEAERLQKAEGI